LSDEDPEHVPERGLLRRPYVRTIIFGGDRRRVVGVGGG